MNKDNFKILIDAILFDGQVKFNMSCFIGKLNISGHTYKQEIKEAGIYASSYGVSSLTQVETTDLFNCDSVGCIAGFATALSNKWKTPEWLNSEFQENNPERTTHNMVQDFESTSNNFLGLTSGQGKKLYYADNDSIWKFVKYYESNLYSELQYEGEDDGEADDMIHQYCEWDDDSYEIDFLTINYKTAADVLTRIMNGEIKLGHDYGDIEFKKSELAGALFGKKDIGEQNESV